MKKLVFVSNYINHHQIPLCAELYRRLGDGFAFVQTEPMEEERIRMGWSPADDLPYVFFAYRDRELCEDMIREAAVVLFGGCEEERYIEERLSEGRPVIRYSERLYKTGQWKAVSPRGLRKKYHDHTRYRKKDVYLLCAGAYVPSDFHIVRAYPGKMLRWGYFPETADCDPDRLTEGKRPGSILWAARFLDWKHPELALETARYLKEKKLSFHMDVIGGGELDETVRRLHREYGLEDRVTLKGFQTPKEVRSLMEQTDIYLATSDRQEGWGAVINEAMNSGCCVVADHMMGAAPWLIRPGENGLLYPDGERRELFAAVERVLRDREECHRMGRRACETIQGEWNAKTAAKRLGALCLKLGFWKPEDISDPAWLSECWKEENRNPAAGPCSAAPVIPERKMYRILRREESAGEAGNSQ